MANMNIRTPRFYTDNINYLLSRGVAQNGSFDVIATGGSGTTATRGIQTGTEAELFDMNPLNVVDFDTSGDPDSQVMITLDLKSSPKKSFIAILNHNLSTADGKIRLAASDTKSHITTVDYGSATFNMDATRVVNADGIDNDSSTTYSIVTPATDGSTIIRFTESDLKFWGIQFEGDGGNEFGSTDLSIGCIMVGEYFEMPVAPDLSVKRSIIFDQVDVLESTGGQRFSNMNSHGRTATSTSKSPFTTPTQQFNTYGGRIIYDLNFSYLASTDVMPTEYDYLEFTDDAVVEDIWNKTNGRHIPFIFSIDKDSEGDNAESEHIFARFAQDSLDMEQVAVDVFNIPMRIEEEF
jgi:hypothetical protein